MSRPDARTSSRPKKRFGQHFLKDPNTARIVAAGVSSADTVLEIGPGRGFLTKFLAERAGFVHALEIDPGVLPRLIETTDPFDNVAVHVGDALGFDYASLSPAPNRLAANLPYNVGSPLVLRLLEDVPSLTTLRFMVQLEVARRMAAPRGTKDYGGYAVLIQMLAKTEISHKVPPTVFDPPPRVRSAVVELRRLQGDESLPFEEYEGVKRLALATFANRRKRLVNNLEVWGKPLVEEAVAGLGYGENARAEELSPADFVSLYRRLKGASG